MALDLEKIKAVEAATGHSVFGSSSLPRIVACPASVGEELNAGLKPPSIYAAKGTELHSWTEKALKANRPRDYILSKNISIEDTAYILDAIDYFFEIIAKHPEDEEISVALEEQGNLQSYGLPEVYGTMDVRISSKRRVDVIDWKYGHGIAVSAKKNIQCISYLGMAVPFEEIPDTRRKLYTHICQPPKQIFEEEPVSYEELYNVILGDVTDAIQLARSNNPPYGPSIAACRFCKANMRCKERYKWLQQQARAIQRMSKDPTTVSNEKWSTFLLAIRSLLQAKSDIEAHAVREIMSGREFPGFKLVSGRSIRRFYDQAEGEKYIISKLGARAYKPKEVVSLAMAEKLDKTLKKDEKWQELVYKPEGAPKLVQEHEAGKPIAYGVQGMMNDIASGKLT